MEKTGDRSEKWGLGGQGGVEENAASCTMLKIAGVSERRRRTDGKNAAVKARL